MGSDRNWLNGWRDLCLVFYEINYFMGSQMRPAGLCGGGLNG